MCANSHQESWATAEVDTKNCQINQLNLSGVQELLASLDAAAAPHELMLDLGWEPGTMKNPQPSWRNFTPLLSKVTANSCSWEPIMGQGLAVHYKCMRQNKLWLLYQVSLSCRKKPELLLIRSDFVFFWLAVQNFPSGKNSQPFSQVNKSKQILRCSTLEITVISGYKKHFPWGFS